MLWLIQRDFLEGKTVQQMVSEALLPVANPHEDADIAQVCRVPAASMQCVQTVPACAQLVY